MPITAAQLLVRISADTAPAEKGIGGFSKMLRGALPVAVAATVVAVAGIGIAAVKMAGDFQAGMTSLVTGAGESEKNIGMISAGILKMAVDTGTSTDQLTAGMFMIESAGYHGAAGLNVLKVAAEGAKVGNADLGVTSDALTTILRDYPNVTNGAAGAMNTLIATVSSGKTHMQDLAGAMSQILPTSSAAGVGLNDVMGAMATMTGEGVPAANAATYLRQTILALDAPSKTAQKALADVGLSSSQVAAEMQTSLPTALKEITDAVGKKFPVGSAQYVTALKNIAGGSRQMQGILDLTGTHMTNFQGNVKGVADQVQKGSTHIVGWSNVQKDFNFKVDKAKEVVQTLMIRLGTGLLPIAGKVVDLFSKYFVPALMAVMGGITGIVTTGARFITFLQGTGPAATAVKIALGALGGAMAGLAVHSIVDMIAAIIAGFPAWMTQISLQITAATTAIGLVMPFLLIGAAIGLVIGIIILIVTHWKQLTGAMHTVQAAFEKAPAPIKILVAVFLGPLILAVKAVQAAFSLLTQHVLPALGHLKDGAVSAIHSMVGFITGDTLAMANKSAQHADQMKLKVVGSFIDQMKLAVSSEKDQRQKVLAELAATTDPAKRHALEMKLGVLNQHIAMHDKAISLAEEQRQKVADHLKHLATQAKHHADLMKMGVIGHFIEMKEQAVQWVQNMLSGVIGKLGDLKNQAVAKISDLVSGVVSWFTQLPGNVMTALSALPGDLLAFGLQLMQKLAAGITSGAGAIGNALKNIPGVGGAISALQNVLPHFATGGTMAGTGIAVVGEEGPELVRLPGGAHITPLARTSGGGISGLPASMAQAHGAARGSANGEPIHVNLYLDGRVVAQIVAQHIPAVVRNATGARSF